MWIDKVVLILASFLMGFLTGAMGKGIYRE